MAEPFRIRAAEPDDAGAAAELFHSTAEVMYERFAGDRDSSIRTLRSAFGRRGNGASREVVRIAAAGTEVAAAMAAFPASEAELRGRRFLRLLLWRTPPWTWRETLRVHRLALEVAPPPPPDSFYVDSLATAPRHRRRGAARVLLADAEASARRLGLPCLALETGAENAAARAFYEAVGFEPAGERPPKGGMPGFVAYVKRL